MSHWILSKTFRFEASHLLPFHDGQCAELHGHSWVGKVYIHGHRLHAPDPGNPESGMVMDFLRIKKPVQAMVDTYLDHKHLNAKLPLPCPTSEAIAQWIYNHLKPSIPLLVAVSIEETCTSACYYTEEDTWPTEL